MLATITPDTDAFRAVMRSTGTVLSGGRAVSFIHPNDDTTSSDWDCYTPAHRHEDFCNYLINKLGGVVQDDLSTAESYEADEANDGTTNDSQSRRDDVPFEEWVGLPHAVDNIAGEGGHDGDRLVSSQ